MKYCLANSILFNIIYHKLNKYLYKYYIHIKYINIVEKPVVYYQENVIEKENIIEKTKEIKIDNKNNIDELLKVMTNKINKINNLI